ncbi:MAG: hypothetical protein ACRCX7_11355 [Cetobacterium sp.]|uniref:hypothetical protein n=1 Tax=Cetobacterium sp. TaxID=2071632 RepID=UPI003F3FD2D2
MALEIGDLFRMDYEHNGNHGAMFEIVKVNNDRTYRIERLDKKDYYTLEESTIKRYFKDENGFWRVEDGR